jgi:hypothetical protein
MDASASPLVEAQAEPAAALPPELDAAAQSLVAGWAAHWQAATPLSRCLLLAALLHLLLALWLGSAPPGSAPPGEGRLGALNVILRGLQGEGDPAHPGQAATAEQGPTGSADLKRWGGAVRSPTDAASRLPEPGAAQVGTWAPATGGEIDPAHAHAPAEQAPPAPDAAPKLVAPDLPAAVAVDSGSATVVVAHRDDAVHGATRQPTLVPMAPARPQHGLEAPPILVPQLPSVALPAPVTVQADQPVVVPVPAPRRQRPLDAAGLANPALPELAMPPPAPVQAQAPVDLPKPLPRPPRPVERAALPAPTLPPPTLPPPSAVQAETPVQVPLPAPRRAAASLEPAALARPELPSPALPPAVAVQAEPAVVVPAATPRVARGVEPVAQPAPPLAGPGLPAAGGAALTPDFGVAAPARGNPAGALPRSDLADRNARPGEGSPDAGTRLGHDLASAPSTPASAPRLNLELPRPRGGEISSRGSMGVLSLLPRPPETKSKLTEGIEKAAKPDCKDAYAGLGLLAAVPLAADALRGKGCKW